MSDEDVLWQALDKAGRKHLGLVLFVAAGDALSRILSDRDNIRAQRDNALERARFQTNLADQRFKQLSQKEGA